MGEVIGMMRLDTPLGCREFLRSLRFGPEGNSPIQYLEQEDGRKLSIDEASDEQVMELAQEMADAVRRRDRKEQQKKNQVEIHRDFTDSYVGLWKAGDAIIMTVGDEAGYSGCHVSKEEWEKIKKAGDEFYSKLGEK